ncbi:ABC transporter ATP-binding protein [Aeribacillus composti]|uniref:ABC transporter ATP-binding protein n=1 Tax=Aeribacillus composti TaxID=1868734 RepID=UPI00406A51CB
MIQVADLKKSYRAKMEILKGVQFTLEPNNIYCLLGRNGAGKTTLMKILSGILAYDSGTIIIKDNKKLNELVHYVSEKPIFLDFLSGFDNLDFIQKIYHLNMSKDEVERFCEEQGIQSFIHELVINYSHGMKHQLALAVAFLIKPKVLLLDEPLVSLDPINIAETYKKLVSYARRGNIVLLSTHMIPIAHKLADEILLLKNGKIHQVANQYSESELEDYVLNQI